MATQTHTSAVAVYLHPSIGRIVRLILLGLAALLVVLLIFQIFAFQRYRARVEAVAATNALNEAQRASAILSAEFAEAMQLVERFAAGLSDGSIPYTFIESRLTTALQQDSSIDAITVAFEPRAFSDEYELYVAYVFRNQNREMQFQTGESRYNYTAAQSGDPNAPATEWYTRPIAEGARWTDPFLAAGAGKVLIEYGVPFFDPADPSKPKGVVAVDYTLEGMRDLVNNLQLGSTGFGVVMSESEIFLAHPVASQVMTEAFQEPENANIRQAAQRALAGESVKIERTDPQTGEDVWTLFLPVESTGWVLGVELPKSDFLPDPRDTLLRLVWIVLTAAALIVVATALLVRAETGNPDPLWRTSIVTSAILLVIILAVLSLARGTTTDYGVPIRNSSELSTYAQNVNAQFALSNREPPHQIPTGVLLQAVRFPDATSVVVSGYVWQRIPTELAAVVQPGITFPQRIDDPYSIEQVSVEEQQDATVYVYAISAALRQTFDPEQYPIDTNDIRIRIAPADVSQNVLLVPDLEAYEVSNPRALPGLDSNIFINNWAIERSFFSYETINNQTALGVMDRPANNIPELTFNVRAERLFLGPFITFVLPAVVTSLLIFAFLINGSKPDEREEIVSALNYSAALFFVIAVIHTALRETSAAIGLTYLEYFYLLLYMMLLGVAANTFLVVKTPHNPLVRFGDNLLAKTAFWPIVLGAMAIITLWMFVFRVA